MRRSRKKSSQWFARCWFYVGKDGERHPGRPGEQGGMSGHHSVRRGRRGTARGARKPQPGAVLGWVVRSRQEDRQTMPPPTLSHAVPRCPTLSRCLASQESCVHTLSPHGSPGNPFPAASPRETAKLSLVLPVPPGTNYHRLPCPNPLAKPPSPSSLPQEAVKQLSS